MFGRRSFLKLSLAACAMPLLDWWDAADALAQAPFTRASVETQNGRESLISYRRGVRAMQQLPSSDPTSWIYQANIHGIPGFGEFQRVFGPDSETNVPLRTAKRVWASCEHRSMRDFLSWHRMYLFYFERIVRKLSMDANFALPYWNYSASEGRALPIAFREFINGDPLNNALYFSSRGEGINDLNCPTTLNSNDVAFQAAVTTSDFEGDDLTP